MQNAIFAEIQCSADIRATKCRLVNYALAIQCYQRVTTSSLDIIMPLAKMGELLLPGPQFISSGKSWAAQCKIDPLSENDMTLV